MANYLEFSGISKFFPGVKALDNISFRADSGKVLALMGENGAGKSTLLKILNGDLRPDTGSISINGETQHFVSPNQAIKAGVSVVYQERQLIATLSVMENIFLDDIPKNKFGFVDWKRLRAGTQEIIDKFGLPIRPDDTVGKLAVAYQQMVEIMKAYRRQSLIIAFDEPTAPLTDKEIDVLFGLIEELKKDGRIILYVSHRMSEIFKITDDIVVFKDGQITANFKTDEIDESKLITAMVGRDIGDTYSKLSRATPQQEVLLEVKDICTEDIKNVSFTLHKGEVLGFAGLVGAGRTEVARAVFGADKVLSGEIIMEGEKTNFKSPQDALKNGIALCPEDRKSEGLVLIRSIRDNVSMSVLKKISNGPFLNKSAESKLAVSAVDKYSIRTPSIDKQAGELSGGNQQKVILGRCTSEQMTTKILILDEPTKGIDVGTKAEIYQMICDFAKAGMGVILISSELTEVINLADNIVVMHNGHVTGQIARQDATEENVLAMAMN